LLPRQARDKRKENSNKQDGVFPQDPAEQHDIAAANPAIVRELTAALHAANLTYYQTPYRFLTEADCQAPGLQRVLASGARRKNAGSVLLP